MAEKTEVKKKKQGRELVEWIGLGGNIGAVCGFAFTFVFRMVGVKGTSMQDTLQSGDKVIIYNLLQAENGDIVVISRSDLIEGDGQVAEPIIKRVIATEGQTIRFDFDTGDVYVDEQLLDEPLHKGIRPFRAVYPWKTPTQSPKAMFLSWGITARFPMTAEPPRLAPLTQDIFSERLLFRLFPTNEAGVIS